MWAISRSSASSARSAAKWAICGLNAQARSAVASTIAAQNSNTASGRPCKCAGSLPSSGSRPTQTSESWRCQASARVCMKLIADSSGGQPSVRRAVLVQVGPAPVEGGALEIDVRVIDRLAGAARADFQIHHVGVAAIDQRVAVAGAGLEAGAHARAQRRLAG